MKPIPISTASALALVLSACIPKPAPPPAAPRPVPPPIVTPAPAPAPVYDSWMDAPATPGDWSYRAQAGGGIALFGPAASEARFSLRCDLDSRAIVLRRAGPASGATQLTIRSESLTRTLAASPSREPLPAIEARLAASDRLLDAMALSKGRFAVEAPGTPTLYLPSWAEVTRVIEDCR